ncbi:MAG: hypothetical protein SHS37scaffold220_10 [Phage 67_12]|nr:MAG: hypothetical protein SHS37scaffold220_10 [Phage 67_12]
MTHAGFIAWAAEGHKDAMGVPLSAWLVCLVGPDGKALRDADGRVVYETQAEWLARNGGVVGVATPVQGALFA